MKIDLKDIYESVTVDLYCKKGSTSTAHQLLALTNNDFHATSYGAKTIYIVPSIK
jgi:hypothetical protein